MMQPMTTLILLLSSFVCFLHALPTNIPLHNSSEISVELFESLEELARIVDISYCVGSTGIQKPFKCVSRCHEFEGFELVDQWKTGVLMSDSCGYVALSHPPFPKRIIVAFRGTYSIANTVVDLSTTPAEYMPYPSEEDEVCITSAGEPNTQQQVLHSADDTSSQQTKLELDLEDPCENCTVHAGFLTSWKNTRCTILPLLENTVRQYPDYQLTLVGHSLGGAVAALASLEFLSRGWNPQVTTFGEPRVGNQALVDYIDRQFKMDEQEAMERTYRRVTHVNDPVPLLPLDEWGYKMHSGEIFIAKSDLQPARSDLRHCIGDADGHCIAGSEVNKTSSPSDPSDAEKSVDINSLINIAAAEISARTTKTQSSSPSQALEGGEEEEDNLSPISPLDWRVPNRYRLWELFFSHRDYFWRLGLCVPGGDPKDWWRDPYQHEHGQNPEHEYGMPVEEALQKPSLPKTDLR